MIFLKPYTVEKLWGDRKLLAYGAEDVGRPIGQVLTISAHSGYSNIVAGGEYDGMTFEQVWKEHSADFGWQGEFPLIIAFVHAADNLSLQVHPNGEWAKKLEGAPDGKEESWVFIEAGDPLVSGVICRSDEVEPFIEQGRWSEIYGRMPVSVGDYVHVRPGTLHAMSKGSFVYEIQQSTDFTYRFYDYGRVDANGVGRPLHLAKATKCLDCALVLDRRKFVCDTVFSERTYEIWGSKMSGEKHLDNDRDVFLCCTVTDGAVTVGAAEVPQGASFILMPHETATLSGTASLMFALAHK